MEEDFQSKQVNEAKRQIASSVSTFGEEAVAYLIFGIAAAIIISIIPILVISRSKESRIASLEQRYQQEVTNQLQNLEKERKSREIALAQIDALSAALRSRVKFSSVFEGLSKYALKKSMWDDFAITENSITLTLITDSFDDTAKAVAAFRQMDSVQSVKLTGSNLNADSKKIESNLELLIDLNSFTTNKSSSNIESDSAEKNNEVIL
ncbi:MAG: hypothetical protein BWY43_00413 [candidate division WS2 bacterium ADurb.Bin280]|uniref:Fimbrial assembly protein (PilN) n=1 Tax=candidate division WS2 bacterium ADurb.Bin280 TaxID=1852829 RepID=A0A1V5SE77_9BACT|nr:MAG: hypothetical protein BWY43_00413 [candidate division WS2 bacterium ADurb.Bin280]